LVKINLEHRIEIYIEKGKKRIFGSKFRVIII